MLKKNVFARLFPAQQDSEGDNPDAASGYGASGEDDYPAKDADQNPQAFQIPDNAYTPPVGSNGDTASNYAAKDSDQTAPATDTLSYMRDKGVLPDRSPSAPGNPPDTPEYQQYQANQQNGSNSDGGTVGGPNPYPAGKSTTAPSAMDDLAQKRAALTNKINEAVINKHRSLGGIIKEQVANFLAGMSIASKNNPNAPWEAVLAGGGAGLGGGIANRTWYEQRQHDTQVEDAQHDYSIAEHMAKTQSDLTNDASQRSTQAYSAMTARQKLQYDQLSGQQKQVLDQWKGVDDFDPNAKDPQTQELLQKAKALGVTLLPKKKGDKFNFQVTPDGHLVIGNTSTGDFKTADGNFSKPVAYSEKDLPDEQFGLKNEKEIEDAATAAVAQQFPNRRVRPEVANSIASIQSVDDQGQPIYPYKNPDGSLNEAKAIQDGVADVRNLYENSPSDYEQRRATVRNKLRGQQKDLSVEVSKFRTALSKQRPRDGATEQPLSRVTDLFKKIMALPPKERPEKLKAFYDNLPNVRIQ